MTVCLVTVLQTNYRQRDIIKRNPISFLPVSSQIMQFSLQTSGITHTPFNDVCDLSLNKFDPRCYILMCPKTVIQQAFSDFFEQSMFQTVLLVLQNAMTSHNSRRCLTSMLSQLFPVLNVHVNFLHGLGLRLLVCK